ncbi:unnamed protein product [Chironomus riparius]|uniref:Ionotropic receptor n=1 Tax=Chironomus riparius TaxID=315576 RepID=A0A9N9WTD6_9DIPT|nr:unnamed protein product [Chironomus riparius]
MKKIASFCVLNYFLFLVSGNSNVIPEISTKFRVVDTKIEWGSVAEYLVIIMNKSQNMKENGKLELAVLLLNLPPWIRIYEGLISTISKHSDDKFITTSNSFPNLRQYWTADFVIILTTNEYINYSNFVKNFLRIMYVNKHTRFIVIVRLWSVRNQIISSIWREMGLNGYRIIYIVFEISDSIFSVYRTEITNKLHVTLSEIKSDKQMIIKDSQVYSEKPYIKIITYASYPTTFIKNNKVYGIDGYFIDEFVKWLNTSYVIVHSWTAKPDINVLISKMQNNVDICLCADFSIYDNSVESVTLFETNGLCLLVPRNIYVSSYENLSLPMDQITLIMSIASAISLVICWKMISRHSDHRLTTSEMFLAVLQLSFYTGAPNLIRLNVKEKLLIFSFIFGSFFISNLYESSILSFMMAEPTVRSAKDLEELNNSNTKFYSFYDDHTAFLSKMPIMRKDLILNTIDFSSSYSLELQNNFD